MVIIFIRDLKGNEYPLLAVKTVNEELNGNHGIELKVPQQRNNNLDLKEIDKLWEINYKTVDYKIMYIKQITKGDSFYLDVRAIPLFYWDFDKQIIHEDKDGHYTGKNAFDVVFQDSGYQYVLVDFVNAIKIEGFGKGETRLEMFKRLIDRFSLEFYIVGKTVYLKKLIGNDTNFMYKYKLNASNVSKSIDASGFVTHIKGFGNFGNESSENSESDAVDNDDYFTNAKLRREYTSPLAEVVGKYEGKPIVDGRVTDKETMDKMMIEAVEKSLEISIEGNLHDVRSIYKEAVPLIGDRVFLIDERINLEQEIRIKSLKQTYDVNDKLVNCEVTFGSESIRSRYKSNLQSVAKDFNSLLKGETKLPLFSLDQVARGMITKIHASENELRYGSFGIQAIDKNNPNNIFGLNSQGWYISTDGGATARTVATAEGIVADAITTGTLRSVYVDFNTATAIGDSGSNKLLITGDKIEQRGNFNRRYHGKSYNYDVTTTMRGGYLRFGDNTQERAINISAFGISTYLDGNGEWADSPGSSGYIQWWDGTYSPSNANGITMGSYNVVALKSDNNRVVLDAELSVSIESQTAPVYIYPYKRDRPGLNRFNFTTSSSGSGSQIHGYIMYGAGDENYPFNAGLRFYKNEAKIDVVDKDFARSSATTISAGNGIFNHIEYDTWRQRSSEKLKTDIKPKYFDALDIIERASLYEFKYIDTLVRTTGLVVERGTPREWITNDGKAINTNEIIMTLIQANKQLIQQVKILKHKMEALSE
uniref:phage tail spike protein n=1 Tax=Nosocomiicoccus ampullae TaxID=489910 RepID=UPI000829608A|nr:phage tail spike protein [Nosocomiicoccus ampullae]